MARKIPVNKDGVPIGWWNRFAMTDDFDPSMLLWMIVVGVVVAAVLYALFG